MKNKIAYVLFSICLFVSFSALANDGMDISDTDQLIYTGRSGSINYSNPLDNNNTWTMNLENGRLYDGSDVKNLIRKGLVSRSWFTKYGVRMVPVAAVAAGAFLAAPSNVQAATVREDMTSGGAPVKLENSNVGASTDFESYGTAPVTSNSSRSTR